jgi:CDP-diacylglycerol--serine O-phosphatidyltransferase
MVGLPIPPASGILISLVVANHAVGGALGDQRYTVALFGVTILLSLLMVSTVKFRSLKDVKLNTGTILFVLFLAGSSVFVWQKSKPQFVLVWLLFFYVFLGIVESLKDLALRFHKAKDRPSVPHSTDSH